MVIAYNLYINSPANPLIFHFDDSEHITWTHECTYDLTVENNTFVPKVEATPSGWGLRTADGLEPSGRSSEKSCCPFVTIFSSGLFTLRSLRSNPLGGKLVHDHNLFLFLDKGKLCFIAGVWVRDSSEIIADPKFVNGTTQDYRLTVDMMTIGKGAPADAQRRPRRPSRPSRFSVGHWRFSICTLN
ncbi:MAG: hypothetical protein IPP19_10120 [Verrucomicrobia bacterium]|nr:hypothetical protein [Verrucomicrobiota bacterium]